MRVDVSPRRLDVVLGAPVAVAVTIVNDHDVIAGYAIRILGADPAWVDLEVDQISLFPGETRTVQARLTVPTQLPAGTTRMAVQVRELTPPDETSICDLDLVVPARRAVRARLDPVTVTAARRASFSLLVENTGNTVFVARPAGDDPEDEVIFRFTPAQVFLVPGAHTVVEMRATARPPLLGSPAVRILGVHLDEYGEDAPTDRARPATRTGDLPLTTGTFVQKPVVSRGSVSLLGLLAAVTVFALVITVALSRLVGASAADRDLALAVAQAGQGGAGGGTAAIAGTVTQLTTRLPVDAVSIGVYAADSTDTAVATAATDTAGRYQVTGLAAGSYKVAYRAAGYQQLWFPGVATASDATTIAVTAGQQRQGVGVALGGVPASVAGTIVGTDVGAATLYLETVADPTSTAVPVLETDAGTAGAPPGSTLPGTRSVPLTPGAAIVQSVPIGTDGTFTLTGVPSPSVYDLVVAKVGYATAVQRVDVGAGESRTGVELVLSVGDGAVAGTVSTDTGPSGGVMITATSGQSTVSAVSLTEAPVGSFTLRNLPTPATVTVVATLEGYNSATQVVTLSQGQSLTGLAVVLTRSSGSLGGVVTATVGGPAGVDVAVTDGLTTVQTVTGAGGEWKVDGLALPGSYTVTFARPDLASQTLSVSLDARGQPTAGTSVITSGGLRVALTAATATAHGDVRGHLVEGDDGKALLKGATITLTSGGASYTVRSASQPNGAYGVGHWVASGLRPGTYTISISTPSATTYVRSLTLVAGEDTAIDATLDAPATVAGTVTGTPGTSYLVRLYRSSDYPDVAIAEQTVVTDATGQAKYDFGSQTAPQVYVVDVRDGADGATLVSRTFSLSPSEPRTVDLTVPS